MDVDEIDVALSRALLMNARTTYAELGKELGQSPQVVHRRVQALIENEIVRGTYAALSFKALGPMGTGDIMYRTSGSALYQNQGQDLVDIFLIAPLLMIGGALQLMRRDATKYLLVLTPVTLMYTGFSLGIG